MAWKRWNEMVQDVTYPWKSCVLYAHNPFWKGLHSLIHLKHLNPLWNLLINGKILTTICKFANQKIELLQAKYGSFKRHRAARRTFKPTFIYRTTVEELNAFFGLFYLQDLFKLGHEDLKSNWCTDETGRDILELQWAMQDFPSMLCCLRFHYSVTRKERVKVNKLAAISEVFNTFVDNARGNV